ncbi:hypothetical protein A2715_05630 [Candidatus Woesebacteria bacterium RIFCSPHIGHO2_01_FULL_39_32]|uniref:Glycosyltransferase subfamily 4-like N-terminal domain-containing protein n=1 Tax=Candidatus Woesebacteria bacterium RIFCSPLOWO2_01_FULL_39_25 TaxID=1802521 RepID=A0A1F8BLS6_9BACT|nr:MAG: hypothetical protein A2124_04075 [Candidatus Woesebacteria bacterium GWB1_37_5]OGM25500.1 MAG: hypothetical protein A2715_05630 [Candidatus Woesebacteria bacterium RIFCSPHIGHO2_01_FULL_39_32]OGM36780.1 MAG: hypothetical protein A3F01_00100 [Candidatus Woesebacteria bacterium RIFCSPHIGHO2_12_FULL_38_11]OGM65031.1 MAG: hypothetical protein A2893_05240 [Candidatus Woesebacteria bacterium RIFCSPLOWO2_01_FULL_39_25]
MKILFFTRLYWPHVGGVEKHLEQLSLRLKGKGNDVTIVTTKHSSDLDSEQIYRKIKIIRFNQPQIKYFGLIYTWLWLLRNRSLIKESDVIHIHDVFIWSLPFKVLFPKKKVYVTFHGQWGKYPISRQDILQKRLGAKLANGVICIGDYIPKNYGIKADIVSFGATDIPKTKYKKENKSIVYVGRLDQSISLNTFFEVFKNLKGYQIEFCGEGELSYEANLYGSVKGFVDPGPYYKKAKYCFASGYLTVLEALAHKCLLFVAYNNPLQKDYYEMTPFRKFIICSANSMELMERFNYYQKRPKVAEKLILSGFAWVKTQTWEKLVEDYLKLWKAN